MDAIREAITAKSLDPVLESVLLVSLMEAADRVDLTCGLQMAYVKSWAPRSFKDLELRMPEVLPALPAGACRAHCMDANDFADSVETDVAYLDLPYNQHSYLSNYHIWESLVRWDKPEVHGVACKRVDCRERKSDYNSKRRHVAAFTDLVDACARRLVSFNNEGYQARPELEALLRTQGEVFVVTRDFKRYVGAQIGIHNPSGERVGEEPPAQRRVHLSRGHAGPGGPDARGHGAASGGVGRRRAAGGGACGGLRASPGAGATQDVRVRPGPDRARMTP